MLFIRVLCAAGSSHILTPTEFLNNLSELAMATS